MQPHTKSLESEGAVDPVGSLFPGGEACAARVVFPGCLCFAEGLEGTRELSVLGFGQQGLQDLQSQAEC